MPTQPTFGAASVDDSFASATVFSWAHTVAAGDNRAMFLYVAKPGIVLVSTTTPPTYGSQTFTKYLAAANGLVASEELWFLANPDVGTATVTVTMASATKAICGVSHWNLCDQQTPIVVLQSITGSTANPSNDIKAFADEWVHDAIAFAGAAASTVGADQTEDLNDNIGGAGADVSAGASHQTGTNPTTMSWTHAAAAWTHFVWRVASVPDLARTARDRFDDQSVSDDWLQIVASGTPSETAGGELDTSNAASVSGSSGLYWEHRLDLTGSYAHIQLTSIPNTIALFWFERDAQNRLVWQIDSTNTKAQKKVGNVTTDLYSVASNLSTHGHFRIREESGTVYWDSSADGITWTNRATETVVNLFNVTSLFVAVLSFSAGTATPGVCTWDNFNIEVRTLTASQPAPSATLTYDALIERALAAAQPAASTTLARILSAARALAAAQPTATGTLARTLTAFRLLSSTQPAASATLSTAAAKSRDLAAAQPAPSGTLVRVLAAVRVLVATQSAPSATLTRTLQATRSLDAAQPAPTGVLARALDLNRTLAAAQPAPSATLDAQASINRDLAASQPAPSTTLVRVLGAFRVLSSTQPNSTATLERTLQALRGLDAAQPSPTGTLSRAQLRSRSLAASQPSATTTLATLATIGRTLTAAQSASTGTLSRLLQASRLLAASQPAATAVLNRSAFLQRPLDASQPTATSTLSRMKQAYRTLSGAQLAASGILNRSVIYGRSLTAAQPGASTTLNRSYVGSRTLTAVQPAPTATLTAVITAGPSSGGGVWPRRSGTPFITPPGLRIGRGW